MQCYIYNKVLIDNGEGKTGMKNRDEKRQFKHKYSLESGRGGLRWLQRFYKKICTIDR